MPDNRPGWLKGRNKASVAAAQRVRTRISALEDDTMFWIEFDSTGEHDFNRILSRKVGDGATYRVQQGWQSSAIPDPSLMHWRDIAAPYPASNCNETMRVVEIEEGYADGLAMLMHHEQYDQVRSVCQKLHTNALLCRRVQASEGDLT